MIKYPKIGIPTGRFFPDYPNRRSPTGPGYFNMEYVFIALLIAASIFIILAVLFQRSTEDGLSHTIAGGADTYYSKDKAGRFDKKLRKWTMIVAVAFVVVVLLVYIVQPDYKYGSVNVDSWESISEYIKAANSSK